MAKRAPDSTPEDASTEVSGPVPAIDSDGVPDRCLSLTIESDWGHFRRIDRTVTKQTYRLPPRTTVAGLLAAVAGVNRDGYYDIFAKDVSAVAIEPVSDLRTVTMPSLGLGTNPDETMDSAGGTGQKTVKVTFPDSTDNRQMHSYELLVNPSFRIEVAVHDEEFYRTLRERLEAGTSYYPPSMGLSEHLAWITYHGEQDVTPVGDSDRVSVDSAVPGGIRDTVPSSGRSYNVERVPGYMEATADGRRTTEFVDYVFSEKPDRRVDLTSSSTTLASVGDRVVAFC